MRKHTLFALMTMAVGCSGQLDAPADDSADLVRTRPAPAIVEWQFSTCLTQHQRDGLIQAIEQLHAANLKYFGAEAGLSLCGNDGEERGALFLANTTVAARASAVALIAIRPLQSQYAFMAPRYAVDIIGNKTFKPVRFDDLGNDNPNGRYEAVSWGWDPASRFVSQHLVDTQTQVAVDVGDNEWMQIYKEQLAGGGQAHGAQSSSDPYVQNLINVAEGYYYPKHAFAPVALAGDYLLQFSAAPSLYGWPLPVDTFSMDASGSAIVSGGVFIQ